MAFAKTNLRELTGEIRDYLIENVDPLSLNNCYWGSWDEPNEGKWDNGICCALSIGSGTFDAGWFAGGGKNQAKADTVLIVSVWNNNKLDERLVAEELTRHPVHGVFQIFDDIVQKLAEWQVVVNDNETAVDLMQPLSWDAVSHPNQDRPGNFVLQFSLNFLWKFD